MKTKLTLFVTVVGAALFGMGCSSLDKGLVAYYPFNGNAKDESGNGNDGSVAGVVTSEDANGQAGKAYMFKGDSSVNVGKNISYGKEITVSAWVKTYQDGEWAVIVAGKKGDFLLAIKRGKLTFGGEENEPFAHDTKSTTTLSDGNWHHSVASFDGSNVKIYVNGLLEASSEHKGIFKKTDIVIGNARVGSKPEWNMNGLIDNVRIYNRALSAEEVKALYEWEKPKAE